MTPDTQIQTRDNSIGNFRFFIPNHHHQRKHRLIEMPSKNNNILIITFTLLAVVIAAIEICLYWFVRKQKHALQSQSRHSRRRSPLNLRVTSGASSHSSRPAGIPTTFNPRPLPAAHLKPMTPGATSPPITILDISRKNAQVINRTPMIQDGVIVTIKREKEMWNIGRAV